MPRPDQLVSFAQNHEDVVLARVLRPWERPGHWVDVGAGHPKFDSVTHLFSTFGWTGINIEPLEEMFVLLKAARPNDINLNLAIGDKSGDAILYVGPKSNRGSSTLRADIAASYTAKGDAAFTPQPVRVETLSHVLQQHCTWAVDFLKIDVEGLEAEVLRGVDLANFQPRIIIVEATHPNTPNPSHAGWEPMLLDAGFVMVLFDGLNRFYARSDDREAQEFMAAPANIHDHFVNGPALEQERSRQRAVEQANGRLVRQALAEIADIEDAYAKQSAFLEAAQELNARLLQSDEELRALKATKFYRLLEKPRRFYSKLLHLWRTRRDT